MLGMGRARWIVGLAVALGVAGGPAAGAEAATAVSSNWSGYVATPHSSSTTFKRVSGSWVVPQGNCTAGQAGYSAAWVGLGGYAEQSTALEQTGTELDCSASGAATYSAWYELVPAPGHDIRMTVEPGDRMRASVTVNGHAVRIVLTDLTRSTTFDRSFRMSAPSTDTAEWIVEAPANCDESGTSCEQLPLADFGTLTFGRGTALSSKGHSGVIGDSHWSTTALTLTPEGVRRIRYGGGDDSGLGGAVPSALRSGAFTVTYNAAATPEPGDSPSFSGPPGFRRANN